MTDNASPDYTPLDFGKYKGLTPVQVAEINPGYIIWMYENVKGRRCSKGLYEACLHDESEDMEEDMLRCDMHDIPRW